MDASGKINFGNLVLLAIVSAAIYFGVLLFPVMVDHFDVKDQIQIMLNRSHQIDDRAIRGIIADALSRVGTHYKPNTYGEIVEERGLGIKAENVVVERNTVTRTIRIAVPYERQVRLKPTKKFITLRFSPEREGPTSR